MSSGAQQPSQHLHNICESRDSLSTSVLKNSGIVVLRYSLSHAIMNSIFDPKIFRRIHISVDLFSLTISEVLYLLRTKEISAPEILNAVFQRIDNVEDRVRAVCYPDKGESI